MRSKSAQQGLAQAALCTEARQPLKALVLLLVRCSAHAHTRNNDGGNQRDHEAPLCSHTPPLCSHVCVWPLSVHTYMCPPSVHSCVCGPFVHMHVAPLCLHAPLCSHMRVGPLCSTCVRAPFVYNLCAVCCTCVAFVHTCVSLQLSTPLSPS